MKHLVILIFILFLLNCNSDKVKGNLEIDFQVLPSQDDKVEPSYQTVVWLENTNNEYLTTLLVSEYLSYGGYNDSTICPSWSRQADWDHVSSEIFDAVTAATPPIGLNQVQIELKDLGLQAGNLFYCVEMHIADKTNILYKDEIFVGKKPATATATGKMYPEALGNIWVLNQVQAKYDF